MQIEVRSPLLALPCILSLSGLVKLDAHLMCGWAPYAQAVRAIQSGGARRPGQCVRYDSAGEGHIAGCVPSRNRRCTRHKGGRCLSWSRQTISVLDCPASKTRFSSTFARSSPSSTSTAPASSLTGSRSSMPSWSRSPACGLLLCPASLRFLC